MLNYSFFNSVIDQEGNPDRPFDANDFSKYFGTLIKNGVFPNPSTNFQIQGDQENMSVKAERGLAWIEGHLRYDDSVFILNIDPADSVLDRIDRVVLRLDTLERCIKWVVKKGEPSAKPIAKELQRDADAYEIGIADVAVNHGIASITQSMITDLRMSTELCGWVTGTVTQIDTTTLFNQLEQWKSEYIEKTNTWTTEQENIFITWSNGEKQKFEDWVQSLKDILSGDVAGNLQRQIDSLKAADITLDNDTKSIEKRVTKLESERPLPVEITIERAKWSRNTYSFEAEYPFSQYDIFIVDFGEGVTEEQMWAWADAGIKGSTTQNVLTAVATIGAPKVDVPVVIQVVKK